MTSDRGVALILALMVLAFLTVLGGAVLLTSTIDIRISDNFKTAVQTLYLAEAGIDDARELVRASTNSSTQLLMAAAGTNGAIAVSTDLATLLASDDLPLIPTSPSLRALGQALTDSSGQTIGRYHVWLRNDNGDGMSAPADSNGVLTLLSIGRIGNAVKTIEVTIRKTGIEIDDPALNTTAGLQNALARIAAHASDIYDPPAGVRQAITNYGSPDEYRIAIVNGDVDLGWGTGYGILLVRGNVSVTANFVWNGLILVIAPGTFRWNSAEGMINGGLFADGTSQAGTGIHFDPATIAAANKAFPYVPIAIKER